MAYSDYSKVQAPAKVYDKNNPPEKLSEAVRLAVIDVAAMVESGAKYDWFDCAVCTAGAVCRAMGDPEGWQTRWDDTPWEKHLDALSNMTSGDPDSIADALRSHPDTACHNWGHLRNRGHLLRYDTQEPKMWAANMKAIADELEALGF